MRTLLFSLSALILLTGCATKQERLQKEQVQARAKANVSKPEFQSVDMYADFGVEKWQGIRAVDTIVVHTANSVEGDPYEPKNVYNIFKKYKVSPHYMIGRDGTVYKMVDENDLAHHAGKSRMQDGRESVNAFSIGIELINSKTDYPTNAQYIALAKLIDDIKTRHKIEHIVGHKDIAPERKSDPWNFDFDRLTILLTNQQHAKDTSK